MSITVLIPKKISGTSSITDINSEYFEREVHFTEGQHFSFVKSACFEDEDHAMFSTLDDAIKFAELSDYTGMIVGLDGKEYSRSGIYSQNVLQKKS